MGGLVTPSVRVHDARDLAQILLDGQTERWRHTIGVARRAEDLAGTVDGEAEILISAAWLHDIGYSPAVHDTGFHPLDGARYLDRHRWPMRLCALVAHHSGARFVAAVLDSRRGRAGTAERASEASKHSGAVQAALEARSPREHSEHQQSGPATALDAYPREESAVSDALTYADQTVGPAGRRMTLAERVTDMLNRHGPDSPNAQAHDLRWPYLVKVADRVERRLHSAGHYEY
jgi:predicted HD phosphohydrolase